MPNRDNVTKLPTIVRTPLDVQKAHDLIVSYLEGDLPCPLSERELFQLQCRADVLCWLLGHERSITQEVLDSLEALAHSMGYGLGRIEDEEMH